MNRKCKSCLHTFTCKDRKQKYCCRVCEYKTNTPKKEPRIRKSNAGRPSSGYLNNKDEDNISKISLAIGYCQSHKCGMSVKFKPEEKPILENILKDTCINYEWKKRVLKIKYKPLPDPEPLVGLEALDDEIAETIAQLIPED